MTSGLVYMYTRNGVCAYVGKAMGVYGVTSVLNNRHKAHMRGDLAFDRVLQALPHVLTVLYAARGLGHAFHHHIRSIERLAIQAYCPAHNVTFVQ
jgi:hypothetical protein